MSIYYTYIRHNTTIKDKKGDANESRANNNPPADRSERTDTAGGGWERESVFQLR